LILADTSIWIDHFRKGDDELARQLNRGQIVMHPWVIGELSLGQLSHRAEILSTLADLPATLVASNAEVFGVIERYGLSGTGIGYVDAYLLAATLLTPDTMLWTRDRRLGSAAENMGLRAQFAP
jgi:predicted nucleic acid-binding protein